MAKITINIPQHKLRSFLKLARKFGGGKTTKATSKATPVLANELNIKNIRKRISPFLLFDWEFFSNELEFE